jgi:hypothetical protein
MNDHERRAWRALETLGARSIELGGKPALDVSPVRITNARALREFARAFHEVAGRSGTVRRHVDRTGAPVFVVTDEPEHVTPEEGHE